MTLSPYKRARASARRVLKEARRTSWRHYVSSINSGTPLSLVWDKVRKVAGKSSSVSAPAIKVNGNVITDNTDVANVLAESMAEISSGASYTARFNEIRRERERRPVCFDDDTGAERPYNLPLSRREFDSALGQCRKTAPGSDGIPYQMISFLPEISLKFLLDLFNRIFREGTVPDSWKEAIVIPIPKPGKDAAYPGNYRPISLTSCLCKLLEKMINFRLMWFLERNNVLSSVQFGFRKMRSTTDALVRLETAIRGAFEAKHHMLAVFFDLEKAYDTTWKHGVLTKLYDIGLRGALPTFIRGFLADRKFRVRVGGSYSDLMTQLEGVPQGSVLSVTLFAIAINDIVSQVLGGVNCSLYVDDFTLYSSGGSLQVVQDRLQSAINRVDQWATYHGFKFSPAKTVAMHFHKRRGFFQPTLSLGMCPLQFVEEAKFLGLTFDPRLTWVPHVKGLKTRATQALGLLRTLAHTTWGTDRSLLLRLYRSLVRSKLDYGCEAYSSASPAVLSMLDPVHNTALRICTGAFRSSPVQSLYAESGEPPLSLHRDYMNLLYYSRLRRSETPTHRAVIGTPAGCGSFGGRMKSLLANLNLTLPRVLRVGTPRIPPWENPPEVDLFDVRKREFLDAETKVQFLLHTCRYRGFDAIYTDGSKTADGVGFAAVGESSNTQGSLPPAASIFTAELHAILAAVKMARASRSNSVVIYSDSRSALQAVYSLDSPNPVVREIQDRLAAASACMKITLCWVPAHVGVRGNERADQRAKAAAVQPWDARFPLPHSDAKPAIRECLRQRWRDLWGSATSNKLHMIKPDLGCWGDSTHPNRKLEVILARLRIGHTRLTHGWLMAGTECPLCEDCQVPLTVAHVLVDCPSLAELRARHLEPPYTLRVVLGEGCDVGGLIRFLSEADILGKI